MPAQWLSNCDLEKQLGDAVHETITEWLNANKAEILEVMARMANGVDC